jgi:hypothetical protein
MLLAILRRLHAVNYPAPKGRAIHFIATTCITELSIVENAIGREGFVFIHTAPSPPELNRWPGAVANPALKE